MAANQPQMLAELGVDWIGDDAATTVERATQGLGAITPQN
jgi:hypothetical protein